MSQLFPAFADEVRFRLDELDRSAASGGLDPAIDVLTVSLGRGGVIHAFGTGHSEAFAMEIAGRAGGFIPTHQIALRDLVLLGSRGLAEMGRPEFERDHTVADELFDLYDIREEDVFIIASNSGANGSTVGLALRAQAEGLLVIAVTSLAHSRAVESKHPSGRRLFEVADVVIDNLAPFGDATLDIDAGLRAGAVSSITAAYIAQQLTLGTADRLRSAGALPPMYISANIPGGDEHNSGLQDRFGARILPYAHLDERATS
ncbi:SIS domain-containing protein [Microbacterium sp. NEAU-LLC]|uniref:SIS domain-containing protein n=1 Tax=Microbacterium helvum TaxID=2773713 RepID=A0ABR8NSJ2_9MICO|nr:SIS domain-containing protein [Microbacterium helvum]MBD3943609.1 SIS domain-containing protein [Microbacterium helvum]